MLAEAIACDFAFQPIVSTSTLATYGVEALARLGGATDGSAALDLLDRADRAGHIPAVNLMLVRGALQKFARSHLAADYSIFCNVDNRVFRDRVPDFGAVKHAINEFGLSFDKVVWEVSEKDPFSLDQAITDFVQTVARSDVRIALDDFGIGISNLERLLVIEPHYVKIDGCFIDGISQNNRKQAIVAKLCGLAHALGYSTIAEGVESEEDFRTAREAGCDFAQGFRIARPTVDVAAIRRSYDVTIANSVRSSRIDPQVVKVLETVQPVHCEAMLPDIARRFAADEELELLPVLDHLGKFKGVIYERDMRQLLYGDKSDGAKCAAPASTQFAISHAKRCPVASVHASIDTIIEAFVTAKNAKGLVLLDNGVYAGYLANSAIFRLAADRDILAARDQNPLTRLPGNRAISRVIRDGLCAPEGLSLAVIDFDHFKAFNDRYGFAVGDRALQLFADMLRVLERETGAFVGHVGGDDFFVAQRQTPEKAYANLADLCARFASDVQNLYSPTDQAAQGIYITDRFGTERFFSLLRASVGLLFLPERCEGIEANELHRRLAALKPLAKASPEGLVSDGLWSLPDCTRRSVEEPMRRYG